MKAQIFVIISLLIFINSAFSQIAFQKTYGGAQDDGFYSVRQTTDGGYIMIGTTMSFGSGNYDVYLVKADFNGDTLWTKTFGGTGSDQGYFVQQTTDSGYIITGFTNSVGPGYTHAFLIKTNANGDTLWTKYYLANSWNGHSGAKGLSVRQTMDGGYIVDCSAYVNGDEILLIKTDASGDTVWTKSYGMHVSDFGSEVQQTADSGYIITGTREGYEVYLLKTDVSGNLIWKKTYLGTSDSHGFSVKQTLDGGYIVAGNYNSLTAGAFLIKTDSIGDTLWTKAYGGNNGEGANSVDITNDSGYIIAGYTQSFGVGQGDGYLIKTNSIGDTVWTKTFGGINSDGIYSVFQTSDSGYILAGGTFSFGVGSVEGYLIKTDANGNSGCYESNTETIVRTPTTIVTTPIDTDFLAITSVFVNSYSMPINGGGVINTLCITTGISEIDVDNIINIYPNPAQDYFIVNLMEELNNVQIEIYNVLGEKIYSTNFQNNQEVIDCKEFLSGIYFVTVKIRGQIIAKKLIINK